MGVRAMSTDNDKLYDLLEAGWSLSGYSTTIMAAGAMTHSVLLSNGPGLVQITVVTQGDKEIGRSWTQLSPAPQVQKKGWF